MNLFKYNDNWVSKEDFKLVLRESGAHDCDILFVHSALDFGLPNPELKNKELLFILLEILRDLKVPTLAMPTFTFSFPNGKIFDPKSSKSRMGALNEFFRKQEGVVRSLDPLMSIAAEGEKASLITNVGSHSIGENSTYDILHHNNGVKFLFLGPEIGACFTFMHYLEWLYDVDYRYVRSFKGKVSQEGKEKEVEQDLFVRYNGVKPNDYSFIYANKMIDKGAANRTKIGNGLISVVKEKEASEIYKECLIADPHCFVEISAPIKDKTFILESEMVAL